MMSVKVFIHPSHLEGEPVEFGQVQCTYDGFLREKFFWLSMNKQSLITERLPASSCLRARLAEMVPYSMVTLSKISSMAGNKKKNYTDRSQHLLHFFLF